MKHPIRRLLALLLTLAMLLALLPVLASALEPEDLWAKIIAYENAQLRRKRSEKKTLTAADYAAQNGVIRGTMFPGLDLPFMGKANETPLSQSQLHELQTLGFAMVDLGEYLDTHTDDNEAFKLFQFYAQLYQKGREAYEKAYGPLTQASAADADCYHWMTDPWPWEISANEKEG